jgi:hypothetical protein
MVSGLVSTIRNWTLRCLHSGVEFALGTCLSVLELAPFMAVPHGCGGEGTGLEV